jgi:teichoic acid transport system permease protein
VTAANGRAAPGDARGGDPDLEGAVAVFEPHSVGLPALGPYLREIWERRRFIQASARASIRGKRSTMAAGQAWAVLDPLFQAALYWFLFAILRGGTGARGTTEGITLLIGGLFLFNFTRVALTEGAKSVTGGRALLMNSSLPRALLPLTSIYKGLLELIPSGIVFLVIYLATGQTIGAGIVFLPIVLVLVTALNLGCTLVLATLSVYIRDVANLIRYVMRVLIFVTPVLFPVSYLTQFPAVAKALLINPFFPVYAAFQAIITGGVPTPGQLALATFWATLFLVGGTVFFLSHERAFALHI